MAYFPHAFQKMLVATAGTNPFYASAGDSTLLLSAGQVGVIDAKTNTTLALAGTPVYATTPMIYLAQGSFRANDKLGPFHGGYKETVKSKGINPKYVSAFYVTEPAPAQNQIINICADGCEIKCNTTYDLRVDIKGSPVLRHLTHNLYTTLSAFSGCCDDDTNPSFVDPTVILLQWADQLTASKDSNGTNIAPFASSFVQASVYEVDAAIVAAETTAGSSTVEFASTSTMKVGDKVEIEDDGATVVLYVLTIVDATTVILGYNDGSEYEFVSTEATATVIYHTKLDSETYVAKTGGAIATAKACLEIAAAYVDTQFGDCSFSNKDHFEKEPVKIYASIASYANNSNDLNGDPCEVTCFEITEAQEGRQGKGYGETLLRELILDKEYRQEPWHSDVRLREVTGDTSMAEIVRGNSYVAYYLLHSVPRKSNPSGVMDNDQYLVKIVADARDTTFETWMNAYLASANSGVQLVVEK